MKKEKYTEPSDFFPKSVRKEFGLGEYNTDEQDKKTKKVNKQFRDYVNKKD